MVLGIFLLPNIRIRIMTDRHFFSLVKGIIPFEKTFIFYAKLMIKIKYKPVYYLVANTENK